jgi:hypothetical protein
MQLFTTDPDKNFSILKYISTNHKWEIGIKPMMFGVRVCGSPVGSFGYTFEYCAGDNPTFAITLMQTMLAIFEALPEDIKEKEVKRLLPSYSVKPIDRDPNCWKALKKLEIDLNRPDLIHQPRQTLTDLPHSPARTAMRSIE